jgi:hypothetical protein
MAVSLAPWFGSTAVKKRAGGLLDPGVVPGG